MELEWAGFGETVLIENEKSSPLLLELTSGASWGAFT
jgi:hypothetical protein